MKRVLNAQGARQLTIIYLKKNNKLYCIVWDLSSFTFTTKWPLKWSNVKGGFPTLSLTLMPVANKAPLKLWPYNAEKIIIVIIIIIIICIIIIKNKKAAANVNEMLVATVAECRRIYGVILNLFVQGVLYTDQSLLVAATGCRNSVSK